MKKLIPLCLILLVIVSCNNADKKNTATEAANEAKVLTETDDVNIEGLNINPISHGTMVLEWDGTLIFIDPVGGAAAFSEFGDPDLILVTDIHGDHMNVETITSLVSNETKIIAPAAVAENFPEKIQALTTVLANGKTAQLKTLKGFSIEAIPMYNLRKEALKFHTKGRGNGYVINKNDKRVYISGDTEDIPEMRNLKNIDIAFVCMNLPYTMTVDSAADAVITFAPKQVYPYHYRGTEGLSNVAKFNTIVTKGNPAVEIVQLDWYPAK